MGQMREIPVGGLITIHSCAARAALVGPPAEGRTRGYCGYPKSNSTGNTKGSCLDLSRPIPVGHVDLRSPKPNRTTQTRAYLTPLQACRRATSRLRVALCQDERRHAHESLSSCRHPRYPRPVGVRHQQCPPMVRRRRNPTSQRSESYVQAMPRRLIRNATCGDLPGMRAARQIASTSGGPQSRSHSRPFPGGRRFARGRMQAPSITRNCALLSEKAACVSSNLETRA